MSDNVAKSFSPMSLRIFTPFCLAVSTWLIGGIFPRTHWMPQYKVKVVNKFQFYNKIAEFFFFTCGHMIHTQYFISLSDLHSEMFRQTIQMINERFSIFLIWTNLSKHEWNGSAHDDGRQFSKMIWAILLRKSGTTRWGYWKHGSFHFN